MQISLHLMLCSRLAHDECSLNCSLVTSFNLATQGVCGISGVSEWIRLSAVSPSLLRLNVDGDRIQRGTMHIDAYAYGAMVRKQLLHNRKSICYAAAGTDTGRGDAAVEISKAN